MRTSSHHRVAAWRIGLLILLSAAVIVLPDLAPATDTPMGKVLCTVTSWFTGNTGKGLATIAVLIVGIFKLMGRVSGKMAILAFVGIAILFGSASLVDAMNAGAGTSCSTT